MKRWIFALVFLSACASLPAKQTAVISLSASETALEGFQTLERSVCFVNPGTESGGHCTNPQAAAVNLTDALHQKISGVLAQAFAAEIKAATALIAWQAGQPAPTDLATYQSDIQQALTAAQALDPSASNLISQIQSAVNSAAQVAASLGVK